MTAVKPPGGAGPIVQYWHADEVPEQIAELTGSFAALNPQRAHLLFDAAAAAEFIGEHLGERERAAFQACGPPAMQADYLRCCALAQLGGVWADAGFRCVRNLDPLLASGAAGGRLFRSYVPGVLMNGLLAFPAPAHPFLRLSIEVSTDLIEMRWRGKVNEITGPLVLTSIYRLGQAGSVDAFLAELRSVLPPDRREHFLRYAEVVCDSVGDVARAVAACEGLRVSAAERHEHWVRRPAEDPPHRAPENHWPSLGSDVYSAGSHG